MNNGQGKRIIREIKVDADKCVGCRACEVACSGFHARPRFSSFNPARSRIRVVVDMLNDVYVPVRAGDYTAAECSGRQSFKIDGKTYSECSFCPSSCPSRDAFKEPDSGLPLKCDLCQDDPSGEGPMCVKVCRPGALIYEEREEEGVEPPRPGEMDAGLQALVARHGLRNVIESVARLAKKA